MRNQLSQRLRAGLWQWRAFKAAIQIPNHQGRNGRGVKRTGAEHPGRDPGPWFDTEHYRSQWPGLAACGRTALLHHYHSAGWRAGTTPHPLFDIEHYRAQSQQVGLVVDGNPLAHFQQWGLKQGLSPCPLIPARALAQLNASGNGRSPHSLVALHPWGPAAQAIAQSRSGTSPSSGQDPSADNTALQLLGQWQKAGGLPDDILNNLAALPDELFLDLPASPNTTETTTRSWLARVVGQTWHDWSTHALLQHVPLPLDTARITWQDGISAENHQATMTDEAFVLHLQPLSRTNADRLLPALNHFLVFDPDAAQVQLMRRLGINAHHINPKGPIENKVLRDSTDIALAAQRLGLPAPDSLKTTGPDKTQALLCLGTAGAAWERSLKAPIWGWPGFDNIKINEANDARLLASWLDQANRSGLQLIRISASTSERHLEAWHALGHPDAADPLWLPPQLFDPPLTVEELIHELTWRRAGCPTPAPVCTPTPEVTAIWQSGEKAPAAAAAVCISLYNYGNCIEAALASGAAQSEADLELIVVDDHSSDDGPERCRRWLEHHGRRFKRALLLRHACNAGLAAARNTAFAAARAPWCFVLDADNSLAPEAVAVCLAIARRAPASAAVVHPLVEVVSSPDRQNELAQAERALISGISWQRQAFLQGNVIDAMALIRRHAWHQVGGYSHIPGGWEDFDFWCKLIEDGWHGVLCPQRLAIYNAHGSSMLATQTHRRLRAVSRLLQNRHPWLDLPLAHSG